MKFLSLTCGLVLVRARKSETKSPLLSQILSANTAELPDEGTRNQAYNALWMASIWWEAGYQQGRKEKETSSCNDIRNVIAQDPAYSDELLPNCNANGQWLPLQCNKESCWCTFLDSGLAIQTLPFVSRNESIICPKRYLTSKNPCTINNSPAGCSGRASSYKYVFDEVQGKCKQMRACSGFDDFETCQKSCAPEPFSLCTLPLNEGTCAKSESSKSSSSSLSGSLSGLLSTISKTRYYFNPAKSTCEEYQLGRCGGNSNSFESKMLCTATCLKDTMVPAKVKLGQAVLDLNLPAWLVVRLRLSSTVANSVPEDMLKTVLEYSKFLSSSTAPSSNKATLEDDTDISQRSMVMGERSSPAEPSSAPAAESRSAELIYPRCGLPPYTGPCKGLSYRWAWSVEQKACVVYPYGGCTTKDVKLEAVNMFDNKFDCVLKCAPIKNQNDQIEVAGYLAAGDPENKPSQLLSMPLTIPQHERAQLGQKLNIPVDRVGYNLPNLG